MEAVLLRLTAVEAVLLRLTAVEAVLLRLTAVESLRSLGPSEGCLIFFK